MITLELLRKHTKDDTVLMKVQEYMMNSWPLRIKIPAEIQPFFVVQEKLTVIDGCIVKGARFVIPETLISAVLKCAHDGHPGIVRTKARIREYYWWPELNSSVEAAVRECYICQNTDKSNKPCVAPVQPIQCPMKPWVKIALAIMGPFIKHHHRKAIF